MHILFLLSIYLPYYAFSQVLPIIKTSDGYLKGKFVTSYGNQTGTVFLGIPIAQPPVGLLRLQPPLRNSPWDDVLDATNFRNACLSNPLFTYKSVDGGPISEDCLYLNVFTNDYCLKNGGCAVMAVLHGGRYTMESPVSFANEPIVNNFQGQGRNIIVVTLPYRLGFLGWANFEKHSKLVKKNLAIYDLERGFHWIQEQIGYFGGDAKRVTVFGHSAGATMADALTTSPRFDGLISSSILMSGSAVMADYNENVNSAATKRIAINMKCAEETTDWEVETVVKGVISCLMSRNSSTFLEASIQLNSQLEEYNGIAIDNYFFFGHNEQAASNRTPLPVLIGTTAGEMTETKYAENASGYPDLVELRLLCRNWVIGYGYDKMEEVIDACVEQYSQPNRTRSLFNDIAYFVPVADVAKSQLKGDNKKVFVYSYTYKGAGAAFNSYSKDDMSPTHSEEFIYILGMHRGTFTQKDYEIERIFSGMIADFVNKQDPSPPGQKWPPFTAEGMEYFEIDFDENLKLTGGKTGYYKEENRFWSEEVLEISGGVRTRLPSFPIHYDMFMFLTICDEMGSHYLKSSRSLTKSLEAMDESFRLWDEHFADAEIRYLHGKTDLRVMDLNLPQDAGAAAVQDGPNGLFTTLMITSGVLLVFAVLYVIIVKIYAYRKRSNYQEF